MVITLTANVAARLLFRRVSGAAPPVGRAVAMSRLGSASSTPPTAPASAASTGFLTYPVWSFWASTRRGLQVLSYDAALLLLVFVQLIIIAGRPILSIPPRHAERP